MDIYYVNLTAGLEAIIQGKIPEEAQTRFIHLRSSHLEAQAFTKFFDSIPDDLLLNLALGNVCFIVDSSTNNSGLSKVHRIGIPLIKLALNFLWFGKIELQERLYHKHQFKALSEMSEEFETRAKYFRSFLKTNNIKIIPFAIHIDLLDRAFLIREFLK